MRTGVIAAAFAMLAACGANAADEPIPSTPLAGQLNGVAWTAGGAIARATSDEGEKSVHIHPDTDLTCDRGGDEPYVALIMPWTAGNVGLGLESDATVFIYFDATVHLVLDGRIELPAAPTEVGTTTAIRVRAIFEGADDDLHVEGEIQVQVCE